MARRKLNWPRAMQDRRMQAVRAESKLSIRKPAIYLPDAVSAQMTAKMRQGTAGKPMSIREYQRMSCGGRRVKITLPTLSFLKEEGEKP